MRLYSFYTNQPVRRQANLVAHTLTTNSIYFDNENIFNVNLLYSQFFINHIR